MSTIAKRLRQALQQIDRPGSFCASGSVPAVLPGLEVASLGPVGLPLTAAQAKALRKQCEPAPYGKGEETLVDKSVRNVWRLKPERFTLTNPDWQQTLDQIVQRVQVELGLEQQPLESHLYDLLLYEKGSFFLPHRDGEKLGRMVATLVVVLPSSFAGGELVVRHDDQERAIDFGGGADDRLRIHFAAFYADCEHEVRPLEKGHRLCLVYNLTLKKGKKAVAAPRNAAALTAVTEILCGWAAAGPPRKLVVTLDHQYTQDGLVRDSLKGVDRARAGVLFQAAQQADCHAYLATLSLHESGAAEEDGYDDYGGWGYEEEEDVDDEEEDEEEDEDVQSGQYKMIEVYDTSLTAEHWSDAAGNRVPISALPVGEDELLDPKALRKVTPDEQYEGYTGNEGMTLDRWYRHAAVVLWPNRNHFDVLCDAGSASAVRVLQQMEDRLWLADKPQAAALRAECVAFAATILTRWPTRTYAHDFGPLGKPEEQALPLLPLLAPLGEAALIKSYLGGVLIRDVTADPGDALPAVCQQFGWETLRPELEGLIQQTTAETLERNVRVLESLCLTKPRRQAGWADACAALVREAVQALERVDEARASSDYRARPVKREVVLAGLVRVLLATDQPELLARLVGHALDHPKRYPLATHVAALTALGPWLKQHVKQPSPSLVRWLDACCGQLEELTATAPKPPADFRRAATVSCKCADCEKLREFLKDPNERVYRFAAKEERRRHLEHNIRHAHCDLDCTTERKGSPHTLVCTKNDASYQAKLKQYHEHLEQLAALAPSAPASRRPA